MSETDRKCIVNAYETGDSVYVLGASFSVSRQCISDTLKRVGVKLRYRLLGEEQQREGQVHTETAGRLSEWAYILARVPKRY